MDFSYSREKMVREQIKARGVTNIIVLNALLKIPRHLFVEDALKHRAYEDYPLPIGEGQTISQPYIVALMTEALKLKGGEKVLEIGTGSGYQTAVLAEIAERVYSVERLPSLAKRAREVLDNLEYKNISIKVGDGTYGWKEFSPYDAIMVTAGAPDIPPPLVNQLKEGGRLVIPVGDIFSQELVVITKEKDKIKKESYGGVRFVKLIGSYGWRTD